MDSNFRKLFSSLQLFNDANKMLRLNGPFGNANINEFRLKIFHYFRIEQLPSESYRVLMILSFHQGFESTDIGLSKEGSL